MKNTDIIAQIPITRRQMRKFLDIFIESNPHWANGSGRWKKGVLWVTCHEYDGIEDQQDEEPVYYGKYYGQEFELHDKRIAQTIERCAKTSRGNLRLLECILNPEMADNIDANNFVQLACFGEILY